MRAAGDEVGFERTEVTDILSHHRAAPACAAKSTSGSDAPASTGDAAS